jgi:hypothetical protein
MSITEKDTDYLNIETNPTPPFDLEFEGEEAFLSVSLKDFAKGYVNTSIEIETDYGIFEIAVHINEDILTVTELTAEAKLYPNPTTGQFTVEGANVAKVEVYNLVGQKVQLFLDIRYLIVYYYLHFRLVLCAKLQNIFKLSMSNV